MPRSTLPVLCSSTLSAHIHLLYLVFPSQLTVLSTPFYSHRNLSSTPFSSHLDLSSTHLIFHTLFSPPGSIGRLNSFFGPLDNPVLLVVFRYSLLGTSTSIMHLQHQPRLLKNCLKLLRFKYCCWGGTIRYKRDISNSSLTSQIFTPVLSLAKVILPVGLYFHSLSQYRVGSKHKEPHIRDMDNAQSDLIEWYKLETKFFQDRVRHTKYLGKAKNRNEKVKEDWSNCEELGRGGFGVVHKQIQKTTGSYRAVKIIDKKGPFRLDYSRELLVMAILTKVRVLTPKRISPSLPPCEVLLVFA